MLCLRACLQQMLSSILSTAPSGCPVGCSGFLARGSGAAKGHGRAVWVIKPLGDSAAQLCDKREGDKAQQGGGRPAQALSAANGELQGTEGVRAGRSHWRRGWSKACFLPCCEVNVTAVTPCSLGMLAARHLADFGGRDMSQAGQALLQGVEGTVTGLVGSPAECPGVSPAWAGRSLCWNSCA